MKNIIRKILKENEFEWAQNLDTTDVEYEIKKGFLDAAYDYNFDGDSLYDMIIEAGIKDIRKLKEIGKFVYDQAQVVSDDGRDLGREDCDCDGCCDDYYSYDYVQEREDDAREEGHSSGYGSAKEESEEKIEELEGEIEELKSEIEELKSRLDENTNTKNIKRI